MERDDAPSANEIDAMLQKLEQRIETLKKRYERYFLGIERRPPQAMRKQVVREVFEAENTYINNTAQKFKLRSLVQKFNTNKARWNRIMRQIEKGTYHRDRKRAERRRNGQQDQEKEQDDDVVEVDPDDDFIEDLDEMDLDEVFDEPGNADAQPAASEEPSAPKTEREKERIKQQKLAEIQRKLGMGYDDAPATGSESPRQSNNGQQTDRRSSGDRSQKRSGGDSDRQRKLEKMRRKLDRNKGKTSRSDDSSKEPTRRKRRASGSNRSVNRKKRSTNESSDSSATSSRDQKLNKLRRNLDRQKSGGKSSKKRSSRGKSRSRSGKNRRVVRRSNKSGDDAESATREVYEKFVKAKQKCNESTDNLSYDSVKKSMNRQRQNLRKKSNAGDVDFDVVIKDGSAYLKPDPKD